MKDSPKTPQTPESPKEITKSAEQAPPSQQAKFFVKNTESEGFKKSLCRLKQFSGLYRDVYAFTPRSTAEAKEFLKQPAFQLPPGVSRLCDTPLSSRQVMATGRQLAMQTCHGCHGPIGGGAHSGSATGKSQCTFPHNPGCVGGIAEDATWRACPVGYSIQGFDQTMSSQDFQTPNPQQPPTAPPAHSGTVMLGIEGHQLSETQLGEHRDRLQRQQEGEGARPKTSENQINDEMQRQIDAHRALNQEETINQDRPENSGLTISDLRSDPVQREMVSHQLSRLRERIPSLSAAPNAIIPITSPNTVVQPNPSVPHNPPYQSVIQTQQQQLPTTQQIMSSAPVLPQVPLPGTYTPAPSGGTFSTHQQLVSKTIPTQHFPTVPQPTYSASSISYPQPYQQPPAEGSGYQQNQSEFQPLPCPWQPLPYPTQPTPPGQIFPTPQGTQQGHPPSAHTRQAQVVVQRGHQQRHLVAQNNPQQPTLGRQGSLLPSPVPQAVLQFKQQHGPALGGVPNSGVPLVSALPQGTVQEFDYYTDQAGRLCRVIKPCYQPTHFRTEYHCSPTSGRLYTKQVPMPPVQSPVRTKFEWRCNPDTGDRYQVEVPVPHDTAGPTLDAADQFQHQVSKGYGQQVTPSTAWAHHEPQYLSQAVHDQGPRVQSHVLQLPTVRAHVQQQYQPGLQVIQDASAAHSQQQVSPQPGQVYVHPSQPSSQQQLEQVQLQHHQGQHLKEGLTGISRLNQGGVTKMPVKPLDFAKQCPAKWAKKATSETINLPLYTYGSISELEASLSGRSASLSPEEFLAKIRHIRNYLEVCCLNSEPTDFKSYGWIIAKDYALKVEGGVEQKLRSWEAMSDGVQTDKLVLAQMDFPRPLQAIRKPGVGKDTEYRSGSTPKERCKTYNSCKTEDKCEYELAHPEKKCILKHECSWCKLNLKQSYKHQEWACKKKQ